MGFPSKKILVVYDHRGDDADMRLSVKHHLRALDYSDANHEIVYYNTFDDAPAMLTHDEPMAMPAWARNGRFDTVILHNTFLCFRWTDWYFYRWKNFFSWIGQLDCPKLAICQDEFDHAALLDEWLFEWNVTDVLSLYDDQRRPPLYPIMHSQAKFGATYPGFIDERAARQIACQLLPIQERPIDISYRARDLPYWFGSIGQLKRRIADVARPMAEELGFRCDISTAAEDVIVGDRWLEFLASSKAIIGCEGGSSAIDWRGEVRARINWLLAADPEMSFADVSRQMPEGWDDYRFLSITPRHFEAAITKTCQILIEGAYNGVMHADVHYIPIAPDFSNLDKALTKMHDVRAVQEMVDRTYEDLYLSGRYTYQRLADQIDRLLAA